MLLLCVQKLARLLEEQLLVRQLLLEHCHARVETSGIPLELAALSLEPHSILARNYNFYQKNALAKGSVA